MSEKFSIVTFVVTQRKKETNKQTQQTDQKNNQLTKQTVWQLTVSNTCALVYTL